jgi:hypothetical protein
MYEYKKIKTCEIIMEAAIHPHCLIWEPVIIQLYKILIKQAPIYTLLMAVQEKYANIRNTPTQYYQMHSLQVSTHTSGIKVHLLTNSSNSINSSTNSHNTMMSSLFIHWRHIMPCIWTFLIDLQRETTTLIIQDLNKIQGITPKQESVIQFFETVTSISCEILMKLSIPFDVWNF